MIIVTMTIKKRPFGIGSWMDLDICCVYGVCVCSVRALCPSFYLYALSIVD